MPKPFATFTFNANKYSIDINEKKVFFNEPLLAGTSLVGFSTKRYKQTLVANSTHRCSNRKRPSR